MLGNVLLSVMAVCMTISYLPQIIKLIKRKQSDDISIMSWALWLICSLAYSSYAIFCSNDMMLVVESSLELFLCLLVLVLTIMYSSSTKKIKKRKRK